MMDMIIARGVLATNKRKQEQGEDIFIHDEGRTIANNQDTS